MSIRVLIVDDQAMVRAGFAAILDSQDGIEVVAQAADGREGVEACAQTRPDVVLMDVRMPVLDGLAATREILAADNPARVIMLTTFDIDDYVYEALRAGASGFLLKDLQAADLISAVRIVAAGEALLAPSVTRRLIETFARQATFVAPSRVDNLTKREREVLALLARGLSNVEIAETFVLAEQTVKTHVGRILAKLGLRDRTQAVVYAYESGLVRPGGP